jgi:hypothetical protein
MSQTISDFRPDMRYGWVGGERGAPSSWSVGCWTRRSHAPADCPVSHMTSPPKKAATPKSPVKRGPGWPATGRDNVVAGRVPENVIAAIDAWATKRNLTRSKAVVQLLELGLKAKGGKR